VTAARETRALCYLGHRQLGAGQQVLGPFDVDAADFVADSPEEGFAAAPLQSTARDRYFPEDIRDAQG
jgi:hypothetical protein